MKLIKYLSFAVTGLLLSAMSFAQTADEIVTKHINAIGGIDNWKKVNSMRQEATLSVQGMDIPVVISAVHNKATKQEYTVMGMTGYSIITAEGGWNFNPMQGKTKPEPITQDELKYGKDQLDLQGDFVDYKAKGSVIESLGKDEEDGNEYFKIKLTTKNGNEKTYFFDTKTNLIYKVESIVKQQGQEMKSEQKLLDYQTIEYGIKFPFKQDQGQMMMVTKKITINPSIDATIFNGN